MKFANKVKTRVSMKFDLILQAVDYVVIKFKIFLIKFIIFENIFLFDLSKSISKRIYKDFPCQAFFCKLLKSDNIASD